MPEAIFRFYAELNDFLPASQRQVDFAHSWSGSASVKDVIEALGVPHPEIDIILVNGRSVGFACLVRDGDRVSVYPVFEALDVSPLVRLRPRPLRVTRFVLDVHLGRLAGYLRMLGFDALWRHEWQDAALARCALDERRLLLTRDRGLLKRREVSRGYCVRSVRPHEQLLEVVVRFDLASQAQPFTRCIACNASLKAIDPSEAQGEVPADVLDRFTDLTRCTSCGRVYWPGSHFAHMQRVVEATLAAARRPVAG